MYEELGTIGILLNNTVGYCGTLAAAIYLFMHFREKSQLLTEVSRSILVCVPAEKTVRKQRLTVLLTIVEILIFGFIQNIVIGPLNWWFSDIVSTGANYFGTLYTMPLIWGLICWIVVVDPCRQVDLITPAYPLMLVFVKLVCFCKGCCTGFECDFGLYNTLTGQVEFPVQLVESGLALAIFPFMLWYRKKAPEGTMYPVYMIVYSATRFFSEFLRREPAVFLGLKTYQILCLIGIVYGLVLYFIVTRFKDRIDRIYKVSAR